MPIFSWRFSVRLIPISTKPASDTMFMPNKRFLVSIAVAEGKRVALSLDRRLAAAIRGLLDRIDQPVQFDRGGEIRLKPITAADRPITYRPGEQRVHLPHVEGLAGRRAGRG